MTEEKPCPICGAAPGKRCERWCERLQDERRLAVQRTDCKYYGYDCETGSNCYGCRCYEPRQVILLHEDADFSQIW